MEGQGRPAAGALLHQCQRHPVREGRRHGFVPLPRLAGGGDRDRRRPRRHRQLRPGAARGEGNRRPLPGADLHRRRPVRQRVHLAEDVSPHPRLGPQGHRHGSHLGGGPGDLGHHGQGGEQAGVQAARRPHQGEDLDLRLEALRQRQPRRLPRRGPGLPEPGLHRAEDALRLWPQGRPDGHAQEHRAGPRATRTGRAGHRHHARMLHGLDPGIRPADAAEARRVRTALAGGAGDRR